MFGSHLSIAGGMHNAVFEAEKLGMDTVQVFTIHQHTWQEVPVGETELGSENDDLGDGKAHPETGDMKHRLFTILAALSLPLCAVTAIIWARSYWYHDVVGWGKQVGTHGWWACLEWDQAHVVVRAVDANRAGFIGEWINKGILWEREPPESMRPDLLWHINANWGQAWALGVPCWLALTAFGASPALWLRLRWSSQRRRALRQQRGLCLTCGYDLRASSGRCPECGSLIPPDLVRKPVELWFD